MHATRAATSFIALTVLWPALHLLVYVVRFGRLRPGGFAGAFWAAGELQLDLRGRFGFGAAVAIATFGSFLALVATQAMTGRENSFIALTVPFAVANGVGAALGLLVILPGGTRTFVYAVLGFAIGGIASGAIAAAAMETHQLNFFTGLPLVAIPGIVGGTAAAWASTSMRQSSSKWDQRNTWPPSMRLLQTGPRAPRPPQKRRVVELCRGGRRRPQGLIA
jgi:hypothetical protein